MSGSFLYAGHNRPEVFWDMADGGATSGDIRRRVRRYSRGVHPRGEGTRRSFEPSSPSESVQSAPGTADNRGIRPGKTVPWQTPNNRLRQGTRRRSTQQVFSDRSSTGSRGAAPRRVGSYRSRPTLQTRRAVEKPNEQDFTDNDPVRFVALGGFEEIGRNMMLFEYRDEIIVIDAGLQFPEEETPGIDYIIPNTTYLEERKDRIKGMIITHGHYDHIGALPYVLDKIGNPIIYTTRLSREVILKRQDDFPNSPIPNFDVVKGGETRMLSKYFSVEFFSVTHNIPDGIGMIIHTPVGKIVHPGEFKFDYDDNNEPKGLETWKWVGEQDIQLLMLDSTGAETPGYSLSERVVEKELEKLFISAKGRIIVATFASLLDRLAEIIKIAERLGRKVAVSGYSMKTNIQIAQNLGYMKIEPDTLVPLEEIQQFPDEKLLILCTGAQGEGNASLMRIANGEHRFIHLKKSDSIVLSSSVVPGNERSVQTLKDNLSRQGATIFHYRMLDIHSSGHAPQEELKTVMKLVRPKYFLPIHGYYFMRMRNAKHAEEVVGLKSENTILADNGLVVEIRKDSVRLTEEQVPVSYVLVDGLGVGDVGEVVLRDRRTLSEEGMLVVITVIDKRTGRVLKNPDIISRGFIYLRENQEMLDAIRKKIKLLIGRIPHSQNLDIDYVRGLIRDQIGQFLYTKTKRRPMVLPVVIEI